MTRKWEMRRLSKNWKLAENKTKIRCAMRSAFRIRAFFTFKREKGIGGALLLLKFPLWLTDSFYSKERYTTMAHQQHTEGVCDHCHYFHWCPLVLTSSLSLSLSLNRRAQLNQWRLMRVYTADNYMCWAVKQWRRLPKLMYSLLALLVWVLK